MTTTSLPTAPAAPAARPVPPAPLDPDALARSMRPFGHSSMLPAAAYTDEQVFAWEKRHVFAAGWVCVGREDELVRAPLTQQAMTIGDVPVLLTRADGVLRAFANTCRHRGHELLGDGCTASGKAVTCPYHLWSYGLDGRLVAAPRMKESPSFDAAENPLVPVPMEVWHGWVMVNATGTAAPLAQYVGAMEELVAPYRPETLRLGGRHTYTLAANYKVIAENYHECYHCPSIHPELCVVAPPDSGDNWDLPGAWVGGSMDLKDFADTMSLDGKSLGVNIEGVDPRKVLYLGLFPNILVSLHPDYVMTHRMVALAPDRTWVECSWLFPEEAFGKEGFDPRYAVDFWDITNREDWTACESVQRGLASPHFRQGPLAPNEDAVHQWIALLGRVYTGGSPL